MILDLESQLIGSYAVYGMLQIIKDICVENLDLDDPTHSLTGAASRVRVENACIRQMHARARDHEPVFLLKGNSVNHLRAKLCSMQ